MPSTPKFSRTPVTGVFKPTKRTLQDPTQHHIGWDKALDKALQDINRPRGTYQVQVVQSAIVDVVNPGHIIEYRVTLI